MASENPDWPARASATMTNWNCRRSSSALRLVPCGYTHAVRPFPHTIQDDKGKVREVVSFGPVRRQHQQTARIILKDRVQLLPGQNATTSGGAPQTVRGVNAALAAGYNHAVVIDIRNFFGTVNVSALEDRLPLSRRIIQAVIGLDATNLRTGTASNGTDNAGARRAPLSQGASTHADSPGCTPSGGISRVMAARNPTRHALPAGAAASPIVAEFIVGGMLRELTGDFSLFTHLDDILILTKSRHEAQRLRKTVGAIMAQDRAGPFGLKRALVHRAADGFDFIGYHFCTRKDETPCRPTDENLEGVASRIERELTASIMTGTPDHAGLRRYVTSWAASFAEWAGVVAWRDRWFQRVAETETFIAAVPQPQLVAMLKGPDCAPRRTPVHRRPQRSGIATPLRQRKVPSPAKIALRAAGRAWIAALRAAAQTA